LFRWAIPAIVGIFIACGKPPDARTRETVADSASPAISPDFTVVDLSGHPLRLSAFKGKVVLLDFWATWCSPCLEEMPAFVELQGRYGDRGLQIIGISMDDQDAPVRAFVQKYRITFPIAMGNVALAQQYGGILGVPVAFLIDRQGRIQYRHDRQTEAAVFDREIADLLSRSEAR
jgi:cytochrome c biogenesis protein CcmG/thiol:disulfide interchange protein DsbE